MSAYIIVQVECYAARRDYDEYKAMVPSSLAAYDGKFAVRGGICETLEGSWKPARLVVLEFPRSRGRKSGGHHRNTAKPSCCVSALHTPR